MKQLRLKPLKQIEQIDAAKVNPEDIVAIEFISSALKGTKWVLTSCVNHGEQVAAFTNGRAIWSCDRVRATLLNQVLTDAERIQVFCFDDAVEFAKWFANQPPV